jgi:hypothetical protein
MLQVLAIKSQQSTMAEGNNDAQIDNKEEPIPSTCRVRLRAYA